MTNHAELKRRIRARMLKTGESYTAARVQILKEQARNFGESSRTAKRVTQAGDRPNDSGRPQIRVITEPRHEFMSILARLAEYPHSDAKGAYAELVERHFGPFRRHAAVRYLKFLRQERGFSYWFLSSYAVGLKDLRQFESVASVEPPEWAKAATWSRTEIEELRTYLRDFAVRADALAFLELHAEFYRAAGERLEAVIDTSMLAHWLRWFHGAGEELHFSVTPAPLQRLEYFPVALTYPSELEGQLAVISSFGPSDERGLPTFDHSADLMLVEIFCRLRINAEISIHEEPLRRVSEQVFAEADPDLALEPGRWHSMMAHAVTSAVVDLYVRSRDGHEAAGRWLARNNEDATLHWIRPLADSFLDFVNHRDRYQTLGDFMPEVVACFEEHSRRLSTPEFRHQVDEYRAQQVAKGPKVVAFDPPNGAIDVDSGLNRITIAFDREMSRRGLAIVTVPNQRCPDIGDDIAYDESSRVLSIPVQLEADTEYAFRLNAGQFVGFQDLAGVPLASTYYSFSTGSRRVPDGSVEAR